MSLLILFSALHSVLGETTTKINKPCHQYSFGCMNENRKWTGSRGQVRRRDKCWKVKKCKIINACSMVLPQPGSAFMSVVHGTTEGHTNTQDPGYNLVPCSCLRAMLPPRSCQSGCPVLGAHGVICLSGSMALQQPASGLMSMMPLATRGWVEALGLDTLLLESEGLAATGAILISVACASTRAVVMSRQNCCLWYIWIHVPAATGVYNDAHGPCY